VTELHRIDVRAPTSANRLSLKRQRCCAASLSLPCMNPISNPFPRRLFDPAISEIRHGDDHRQVARVSDIAMPQPGSQKTMS